MGVVMKEITAFPFVASDDTGMIINTGMTLRDYFAAKAMQAMAEGRGAANLEQGGYVAVSMMAYKMADAMMKARDA
jgi:hypothetical protein